MPSSDAMLVERLPRDRSGDELRELYRRYAGELFGFASSALGDREQAEEVVQDVFAQLWRHAEDYDQRRASVRTWLYAIARNRIIDAHRRAAARPSARPKRTRSTSISTSMAISDCNALMRSATFALKLSMLIPKCRSAARILSTSTFKLRVSEVC